jgi:hypothetical protein
MNQTVIGGKNVKKSQVFILIKLFIIAIVTNELYAGMSKRDVAETTQKYTVGKSYELKIMMPKKGYFGYPGSHISSIPCSRETKSDADFYNVYIRVTNIGVRALTNGIRIVQKIDVLDDKGNIHEKDVYFTYNDIIDGRMFIICREKDDNKHSSSYIMNGFPFPFYNTRIPSAGFFKNNKEGYASNYDRYLTFEKKCIKDKIYILAENTRLNAIFNKPLRCYEDTVCSSVTNKANIYSKYYEVQGWDNPDECVWTVMKRYDENGQVIMKCYRINRVNDSVKKISSVLQTEKEIDKIKLAWIGEPILPGDSIQRLLNIIEEHQKSLATNRPGVEKQKN